MNTFFPWQKLLVRCCAVLVVFGALALPAAAQDMTINKIALGSGFVQGGTVTYLLTVSNSGAAATTGTITMTDVMPTGLTATSATGANWTCAVGTTVSCTRSVAMAAGTSSAITLNANIAANAPTSIANTASVSGGGETVTNNNAGSSFINVTAVAPDLTITKIAQGSPFQQGGTVAYQLTVTNGGNGPTSGTITLTDIIPTGLTATSATGTNWTCSVGTTVLCTRGVAMAAGASSVITLNANIASNAPASITNTASVSGGGETVTNNNAGSSFISVTPVAPDLTVTKVAQGSPFQQGGTVTYLLTVANGGNGATTGTITVQDIIPTGLTVTSATGANWTCTTGATVTCTRSTALAAGTTSVITLNANIAANAPASITNTATVSVSGESNSGNNAGSSVISVTAVAPDLTITKIAQGAPFQQGGTVAYQLTVTNGGNGPTTGTITVQDIIPTGLTATSATGTSWTCTTGATVTCSRSTAIAAGTTSVIALNANIAANAPASITNTATVSVSGESNSGNNAGSSVISVTAVAPDLTITKIAQGAPFQQGGTVAYQLTVTNGGNGPTSGTITVQDIIPTGLTVTSATGASWTCTTGATVTCARSTALAAGTTSVITLNANIAANAPASITNTAAVSGGGESNSGNNAGSSVINVASAAPDLTITKVAQGSPFQQGGTVTYLLTVTNSGNGPTSGTITLTDIIPTGLTATSATGTNWTCTVGTTLSCTRSVAMAAGASSVITLVANIAANAPASITNTATVSGGGESNSGNNAGSSVINVASAAPDLTITKVAQGSPFQQGGTVTYLLTVTNSGNAPTSGTITLTDIIPTGLTATSATGTNWTCTVGTTVSCTRGVAMAAGASSIITLVANIAANAPASITNTASVSGGGETVTNNNAGSSFISVTPVAPDLTITKIAQGASFQQGGTVTYLLTVANGGNGPTSGTITLTDIIPTGLTATSATGTNWTCSTGVTVTCTRNTALVSSATSVIILAANIAANAPASITNTATVAVSGESNSGNNDGTSVISVAPPAVPVLLSVVSRKLHNGVSYAMPVDFTQPVEGAISIEPRTDAGGHTLVLHFDTSIKSVDAQVTVTDAKNNTVGSATAAVVAGDVVVVLSGVPDRQRVILDVSGINGSSTQSFAMGFMRGDVNGSAAVGTPDVSGIKARSGQAVTSQNYLFDVNTSGTITAADIVAAKARPATPLP